jgi:hypothetical protein
MRNGQLKKVLTKLIYVATVEMEKSNYQRVGNISPPPPLMAMVPGKSFKIILDTN